MQNLDIPASIWLNFAVLVAAAGFVWFRLGKAGIGRHRSGKELKPRARRSAG